MYLPTTLDMIDCVPVKVEASTVVVDEFPVEFTTGTVISETVIVVGNVEGDSVEKKNVHDTSKVGNIEGHNSYDIIQAKIYQVIQHFV